MQRAPFILVLAALAGAVVACGDDNPSGPGNPVKTVNLEAEKVSAAPSTTFWANADYAEFTASSTAGDGSTGQAYVGEFNMTGSKLGFDVPVRMKAAYTDTDLYIWAQWQDNSTTNDLNRRRWFFNAGAADVLPTFAPGVTGRTATELVPPGWSSNLNDDKIGIMWDIMNAGVGASATDGRLFATSGCAMTCHTPSDMYPDNGRTDLWHWKTSRSNPLGYVNDQYTDAVLPGRITDTGELIEARNRPSGGNNTSGPAFVWDPTKLNQIVRGDGAVFDLDPQVFLAATAAMPIEGDAIAGDVVYQANCASCHNADGLGQSKNLADFGLNETHDNIVNKFNANGVTHGGGNLGITDPTQQNDLVSRIRAFTGAPGYTLQDVTAPNDAVYIVNAATVYSGGTYTVIIKRKLATLKPTEDVQFTDLAAEYPFSVAIMDYDGKNHAGGVLQKLIFRP